MIYLKRISVQDVDAGKFEESSYELVATYPIYEPLAKYLLANLNGEGDLDTENYLYDIREED